ncbi:MAG: DOMON-like domain-containing protein [Proteobacteria bacterium]|nr:MAG: DOMON-like domain-containing protein [Pseudomonadota bacterium]
MTDWDFLLVPYGGTSVNTGLQIRVQLSLLEKRTLRFLFLLEGPPAALNKVVWPKAVQPERRNELWKTTCFELFFGPAEARPYFEMNLSPSGDWNVYAFSDYREGMKEATIESPFRMSETSPLPRVEGLLDLSSLGLRLEKTGDAVLGATAVMEYQDGQKEYWALAHKGDKPDFHVRSSFTAYL